MSDKKKTTIKNKIDGKFKKGNKVGAKTRFSKDNSVAVKYKEEFCTLMVKFFAAPEPEVYYERSYYKDGTVKSEKPIIMPPKFPTFELFAASINVTARTLLNWSEQYPRFSAAYAQAKDLQLGIAKANGVGKMYDGNFTKFILVNDHGMTDKSAIENSQEKPFEVNINVRKS